MKPIFVIAISADENGNFKPEISVNIPRGEMTMPVLLLAIQLLNEFGQAQLKQMRPPEGMPEGIAAN
jgi:hypothetical protein